jgi:hypothetical protein
MLGRHVYEVTELPHGNWTLHESGQRVAVETFQDRDAAIVAAERLARAAQPSKIIVQNADGTVDHERLFGVDKGVTAEAN